MPIFIANQTARGGDVQLWPSEWDMVVNVLTRDSRSGPTLAARIRESLPPVTQFQAAPFPVRVAMTNDEIEMVSRAYGVTSR